MPESLPRLPPGSRVLELGCGNGKTLGGLISCGFTVSAIDFSRTAAELTRNSSPPSSPVEIVVADVRGIPFRAASFDAVVAYHVLGHMNGEDRRLAASEIRRVLRPGGTACFRDFSTADFRYGKGHITEPGTFTRGNGIATHYFTESETVDLFTGMHCTVMCETRWTLRVRGTDHTRAEIVADFSV